jgi:hypothetical protein
MLTKSDMEILASKFRKIRPIRRHPTEGETHYEVEKEFLQKMDEWKFFRNHVADACMESNWRFKRDVFFRLTEA